MDSFEVVKWLIGSFYYVYHLSKLFFDECIAIFEFHDLKIRSNNKS